MSECPKKIGGSENQIQGKQNIEKYDSSTSNSTPSTTNPENNEQKQESDPLSEAKKDAKFQNKNITSTVLET